MESNVFQPHLVDKITDRIYIGCFQAATNLDFGNRNSITHVLNCTPDAHPGLKELRVNQLNVHDGHEMAFGDIRFAIDCIETALHNGGRILVHCHAGISRSTSMVIAFFMHNGFSWDEALEIVRKGRPQAWPHPAIERSVKKFFGTIDPSTTLLGV
jgi:hypothetical protein